MRMPGYEGQFTRNRLWLTSDTHFGHKNIAKFQQRPESHEVMMLSNWIDRVGETDPLLHLGDVFLGRGGNPERWMKVLARMPGDKYLILGNHDRAEWPELYERAGFKLLDYFVSGGILFSHYPIGVERLPWVGALPEWHTNVHGHVHGNPAFNEHDPGTSVPGVRYINVSVEVRNLAPVQLGSIL